MQILFLNHCKPVQPYSGHPLPASVETLRVKRHKCPDKVVMTQKLQIFQCTVNNNNNNSALTYIFEYSLQVCNRQNIFTCCLRRVLYAFMHVLTCSRKDCDQHAHTTKNKTQLGKDECECNVQCHGELIALMKGRGIFCLNIFF